MKIAEVAKATTESIAKFLDTSPRDELYSANELYEKFGVSARTIRDSKILKARSILYGTNKYWGSPSAIQEFQRQVNGKN